MNRSEIKKQSHDEPLTISEYTLFLEEIDNQNPFRRSMDMEAEYYDGNQLDSEVLNRLADRGLPPAVEPLIGSTIDSVRGIEVKNRTDWRVEPDTANPDAANTAKAIDYKLNQAERMSGADQACSDGYGGMIITGLAWTEVSKEPDPFRFPYRCHNIPRNQMFWDMASKRKDLSDCRWLIRQRWIHVDTIANVFPDRGKDFQEQQWRLGTDYSNHILEDNTDFAGIELYNAWGSPRGYTVEEQNWYDGENDNVLLSEVWYRRWALSDLIRYPDGRVVEFDGEDQEHCVAVECGGVEYFQAITSKMRRAFVVGATILNDDASPYKHGKFPYVPWFGKQEDRTNIPYGIVRGMIYLQDEINARTAKMQWLLSSKYSLRTDGAFMGDDDEFKREAAQVDADFVLDQEHMAKPGATFEVNFQGDLNSQQYQRLLDARQALKAVAGITEGFMGGESSQKTASGYQNLIDQSTQTLAIINDNGMIARANVGKLLMALVVEDIGDNPHETIVKNQMRDDETIVLNEQVIDENGQERRTNALQQINLNVVMTDVPSTPSFKAQQLDSVTRVFETAPDIFKPALFPHVMALQQLPKLDEILEDINEAKQQPTPEQIQEQIDEGIQQGIVDKGLEIKEREVAIKERKADAEIANLIAEKVGKKIDAYFSSVQAAGQVAMNPGLVPISDAMLDSAGHIDESTPVDDSIFPAGIEQQMPVGLPPQNTSPQYPPVPQQAQAPMPTMEQPAGAPMPSANTGIETAAVEPVI